MLSFCFIALPVRSKKLRHFVKQSLSKRYPVPDLSAILTTPAPSKPTYSQLAASGNNESHDTNLPIQPFPFPTKPALHQQLYVGTDGVHASPCELTHTGIDELHSFVTENEMRAREIS